MLKQYLEQRHIDLDTGRSCLALEREYWNALEVLAYEDGWHNWRDFFYVNVLPDKPDDMPLASYVRRTVTACLFSEYDKGRA
jgi:predicted DNA-binding ribbon-helix-helix protein